MIVIYFRFRVTYLLTKTKLIMKNQGLNIIILSLFCFLNELKSQCGGYFKLNQNSTNITGLCNNYLADNTKYSDQDFYIPSVTNPSQDPLIGVKMVLHMFRPSNMHGHENLYTDVNNSSQYNTHSELVSLLNFGQDGLSDRSDRYSTSRAASYPIPNGAPNMYVHDSRVFYKWVNIYYYTNDALFYDAFNDNGSSIIQYLEANYPERIKEGMPVISSNNNVDFAILGYNYPYAFVRLRAGFDDPSHATYQEANRKVLRHELGHCMGWLHPYVHAIYNYNTNPPTFLGYNTTQAEELNCNSKEYLSDLLPMNNSSACNARQICGVVPPYPMNQNCQSCVEMCAYGTNNVMGDGFPGDWMWMSPQQMGRRIRNLHLDPPLRQYALEAKSNFMYPWNITGSETWNLDIQMYRDIVVKSGNTLTIKCKVAMAANGKIVVEKGAKLIIDDGGEVTGWCKKTPPGMTSPLWKGIEVIGTPNQHQLINNFTGYSTNHGIVEVRTLGKVSHAQIGISNCKTDYQFGPLVNSLTNVNNTYGGIILADNAVFENNVHDIVFYNFGNSAIVKSKIVNSTFKTTSEIGRNSNNILIIPNEHIKLFKHNGVKIEGCLFEYAAGSTYNSNQRGAGIYSTDSYFNVDKFCSTSNCTNGVRCKFKNMVYGVYVDNTNPLYSSTVKNCDFENNSYGVLCENVNNMDISENSVTMNTNLVGMYMYKSKYYNIKNNALTGGSGHSGKGIVLYDSQNGTHKVYRNTLSTLDNGVQAIDNNGGYNGSTTGLKINCNDFSTTMNRYDIVLTKSLSTMPVINLNQGQNTINDYVRNLYYAPYFGSAFINKIYVHPSSDQTITHLSTVGGSDNPHVPNIQTSPQISVLVNNVSLDYSGKCTTGLNSSGGNNTNPSQKLANLNNYSSLLRDQNISEGENINRYELQATLASKFNLFLSQGNHEDDFSASRDSAISLIETNEGEMQDADVQLVFTYMRYGEYSAALDKIESLPNNTHADWKAILNRLVELEQDTLGIFKILDDAEAHSFFTDYATTEGKDGQACAQAVLKAVYGTTHEYPLCEAPETPQGRSSNNTANNTSQEEPISISNNEITKSNHINIYPNPAQRELNISYYSDEKEEALFEVKDLLGKTIYTTFIKANDNYLIPLGKWSNGIYLVTINNINNEVIYKSKIVKQD